MRDRGPKHRICRRVGAAVCGRPNCPTQRRPYPPGQHGRGRRKETEYSVRLLEKQKLRAIYGLRERQFLRLFEEAQRRPGLAGENLLVLLEQRLDVVVWRLGFATSIWQARQLVVHGHVALEGRRADRPSTIVRPGQTVEIRDLDIIQVREAVALAPPVPPYLAREDERFAGRLVRPPARDEIPLAVPVDERLVVEFYAR